jgi:hypothetical protein
MRTCRMQLRLAMAGSNAASSYDGRNADSFEKVLPIAADRRHALQCLPAMSGSVPRGERSVGRRLVGDGEHRSNTERRPRRIIGEVVI